MTDPNVQEPIGPGTPPKSKPDEPTTGVDVGKPSGELDPDPEEDD